MARVYYTYSVRGNRGPNLTTYAILKDYERPIDAVTRSAQRKTGLKLCAGPRPEGTTLKNGNPFSEVYYFVLGEPAKPDGWTPRMEVTVWIPINQ